MPRAKTKRQPSAKTAAKTKPSNKSLSATAARSTLLSQAARDRKSAEKARKQADALRKQWEGVKKRTDAAIKAEAKARAAEMRARKLRAAAREAEAKYKARSEAAKIGAVTRARNTAASAKEKARVERAQRIKKAKQVFSRKLKKYAKELETDVTEMREYFSSKTALEKHLRKRAVAQREYREGLVGKSNGRPAPLFWYERDFDRPDNLYWYH